MRIGPKAVTIICAVIGGFIVIQLGAWFFPTPYAGQAYVEFITGAGFGALARYLYGIFFPAKPPSITDCPSCGREMDRIDKSTMSGRDMRTYRCEHCEEEHVVDFGIATWQAMSDARESENQK